MLVALVCQRVQRSGKVQGMLVMVAKQAGLQFLLVIASSRRERGNLYGAGSARALG
jgi:hypothetical protein